MFETTDLLRTIGIPSFMEGNPELVFTTARLEAATLNKIDFLYLENLSRSQKINSCYHKLIYLRNRQTEIIQLLYFLSELFESNNLSYTVMKTIRPFSYVGSDVDILVEKPEDFSASVLVLQKMGFILSESENRYTATLAKSGSDVFADLHLEVTVSNLPYLNKPPLFRHIKEIKSCGYTIKTLDEPAEIVLLASHGLYKEQMFTLADFYTTILSLTPETVNATCELARETNSTLAVNTVLLWAKRLINTAFKTNMPVIENALQNLGPTSPFLRLLNCKTIRAPLKFSKIFICLSLLEKITNDQYVRSRFADATIESLSKKQLLRLLEHFQRQSY